MAKSTDQDVQGILAEFNNPGELLEAAKKVREAGYTKFDSHSPFPIHGMDQAMGMKRSVLGWVIGIVGLSGAAGGFTLQWWVHSVAYPVVLSGKPYFAFQAYVPITFGFGVLFGAFAAVLGMFHFNKLPRLFHPVFYSDRFSKASDDGFFLSIEASDPKFDPEATRSFLQSIGASYVEELKEK
ncbi:MAG: DUF3341 domain-containing protein [Calditrichaeota bacterium]|nr:MAG: DUF3341 domain-containing protein [Calditrichota bacterium]